MKKLTQNRALWISVAIQTSLGLSIPHIAKALSLSERTIYRVRKAAGITAHQLGREGGRPTVLSRQARQLIILSDAMTKELAQAYGVSRATIWRIRNGRTKV